MNRLVMCLMVVSIIFFYSPAFAQTPDGETPAQEDVCAGQVGAAYGLCNAYCEAMDCDSADAQASNKACNRVFDLFMNITGEQMPPCEVVCVPPICTGT